MTKKNRIKRNFFREKQSWVSSGKVDSFSTNFSQMYRNLTLGFLGLFYWPILVFFYFFKVSTLPTYLLVNNGSQLFTLRSFFKCNIAWTGFEFWYLSPVWGIN